ncbi:flavodoxin domain-containing protein [Bacillus sp. FJAT-27445]|uniref:flavodoxin domain-containing protein n=1 Tax=Bacillus sp. FJAT-27445 TaxID=1679166 RepID=UPI00074422AA|nr:flavodoxin domain-containing protein [Bacillus sp. FJAT-27445]
MALTNYDYKIGIVYESVTGNTRDLAESLQYAFYQYGISPLFCKTSQFPLKKLKDFDAIVIVTYTWGSGEIPSPMQTVYEAIELQDLKHVITGIAGTGDSFYPHFCGAVDAFRDMLFVKTTLAATLKVELAPQDTDLPRCRLFIESMLKRLGQKI